MTRIGCLCGGEGWGHTPNCVSQRTPPPNPPRVEHLTHLLEWLIAAIRTPDTDLDHAAATAEHILRSTR
jgi:hypothetical protein